MGQGFFGIFRQNVISGFPFCFIHRGEWGAGSVDEVGGLTLIGVLVISVRGLWPGRFLKNNVYSGTRKPVPSFFPGTVL